MASCYFLQLMIDSMFFSHDFGHVFKIRDFLHSFDHSRLTVLQMPKTHGAECPRWMGPYKCQKSHFDTHSSPATFFGQNFYSSSLIVRVHLHRLIVTQQEALIDLAKCAKTSRNSAKCLSATVTCLKRA